MNPVVLMVLVNLQRIEYKLPALRQDAYLTQLAEARCKSMVEWSHKGWPDKAIVAKYRNGGENLAMNFAKPDDAVAGWMASPTHRANVMDKGYQAVGTAVCDNAVGKNVIVQLYGEY